MRTFKVVINIDTDKKKWTEKSITKLLSGVLSALQPKEWNMAMGVEEKKKKK